MVLYGTLFVLITKFTLGKVDVKRDEERSFPVVVIVVGHALVSLSNSRAWPCDFLAHNVYLSFIVTCVIIQKCEHSRRF